MGTSLGRPLDDVAAIAVGGQRTADSFMSAARAIRSELPYLLLSATTGDGLADWYQWLKES